MHSGGANPTLTAAASWIEAIRAISAGGLGAVSIVDSEGRLAGLITDGDLRRTLERKAHAELENLACGDFMTRNPIAVSPRLLAFDALRLMEDRPSQIAVLPVVDDDHRCVGLLRLHDIVRSGL